MDHTFYVKLNINETVDIINNAVVKGSITGKCIDSYTLSVPNVGSCVVLVYEKHYYRASNWLTLTVVIDDFDLKTKVHCISGGGGQGLFNFDWGASGSFSSVVVNALKKYRI